MVRVCQPGTGPGGVTVPSSSVSISSFFDSHPEGKGPGNPGIIVRRNWHCNLIGQAPTWEWGELNKPTPSAWVGFTLDQNGGHYFYVQNVQVQVVPSTIYGITNTLSTTATITAWFDSSITAGPYWLAGAHNGGVSKQITFYNRDKSLELAPNFPISQTIQVINQRQ